MRGWGGGRNDLRVEEEVGRMLGDLQRWLGSEKGIYCVVGRVFWESKGVRGVMAIGET